MAMTFALKAGVIFGDFPQAMAGIVVSLSLVSSLVTALSAAPVAAPCDRLARASVSCLTQRRARRPPAPAAAAGRRPPPPPLFQRRCRPDKHDASALQV